MTGGRVQSPVEEAVLVPGMTIFFEGKVKRFEDGLFERGLRQPQNLHHTRHRGGGRRGGRVYEPSVNHGQMRGFQDWGHSHARVDGSTRHWDGALGWRRLPRPWHRILLGQEQVRVLQEQQLRVWEGEF